MEHICLLIRHGFLSAASYGAVPNSSRTICRVYPKVLICVSLRFRPENHYVRIKADNRLEADGTLRGTFTLTAEGQSDSNIRRIFTTGFQSEWKSTMERQLLAISPKARLLSVDYGKNPKDYQAAPIKITFRYEIPDYALKGEGEMFFRPMVMNNLYNQVRSYMWIDTSVENRK